MAGEHLHPDHTVAQNELQDLRTQAQEHLLASAELMRQLGARAAHGAAMFTAEDNAAAHEQAEADTAAKAQAEQDGRTNEAYSTFFSGLPQANRLSDKKLDEGWSVHYRRSGIAAAGSIEDALQADATLLWLPVKFQGDPALRSFEPAWQWADEPEDGWENRDRVSTLITMKPAYIIGRRQLAANASATDGLDEVLLYPAFHDPASSTKPPLITAHVSSRQLDRLDELSLEQLAEPLTRERFDAHKGESESAFVSTATTGLRRVADNLDRNETWRSAMPPADDTDARKNRKMTRGLQKRGLQISGTYDAGELSEETVNAFYVADHARRLAVLFGRQELYDRTIGTLNETA